MDFSFELAYLNFEVTFCLGCQQLMISNLNGFIQIICLDKVKYIMLV